ncbi:MAG: hypothetical protein AABW49_03930 [Nanoarchaeota archaeon]
MKQTGWSDDQIVSSLEEGGYSEKEISDAMSQVGIKYGVGSEPRRSESDLQPSLLDDEVPVPSPDFEYSEPQRLQQSKPIMQQPQFLQQAVVDINSNVNEIVESVVQERWNRISDTMTDLEIWRSRVNDDIVAVKQELIRLGRRFDMLQGAILGKVDEYSQGVQDMTTEMKALEKVFQNIMEPLTSNIKELNKVTEKIKKF